MNWPFTQPEAAAVANPLAISACTADAASSTLGKPIDQLFWCAGSWGHLYPLSGHTLAFGSLAENTSHLAARAIAAQHRRGLARRTMGNSAAMPTCYRTHAAEIPIQDEYVLPCTGN